MADSHSTTQNVDLGRAGDFKIHKGKLHRLLGIPEDQHIPLERLHEALHSDNEEIVKAARAALGFRAMQHSRDGFVESFDSAMVFALDGLKPRQKIQPPAGMPWDINGQPVGYFKSEALRAGRLVDSRGRPHEVPGARIDKILASFNKSITLGHRPHIPPRHEDAGDGSKNLGFIVDAMKEGDSLYQIEQFIGDDAIKTASRTATSICTLPSAVLHTGEVIEDFWDHSAAVPDPQLGVKSQCTLAASRSTVVPLCLSRSKEGDSMPQVTDEHVNSLRDLMGKDAPADLSKDNAMQHALVFARKQKDGLALSRLSDEDFGKVKMAFGREVPTDITADNAALKLAEHAKTLVKPVEKRKQPDPAVLYLSRQLLETKRNDRLKLGKLTKATADLLESHLIGENVVTGLTLSRGQTEADADILDKVNLCMAIYDKIDCATGLQMSGGKPADDPNTQSAKMTPERKAELLQMAGYSK